MKSDSLVFKTKHSLLSITRTSTCLELRAVNDTLQSMINLEKPDRLELKNLRFLMGILLFSPTPQNVLLLGTGGGSLIHFLRFQYPQCRLTSVEIDSELQALMHHRMLLPEADEKLTYVIDDAEHYLNHCQQQFDLILVDIFSGSQSPGWLLDSPSIRQMHKLLDLRGAVGYNLIIDSEHAFKLFYRNLTRVFAGQALFLPVDGYDNTIAYGFRYRPTQRDMSYYRHHASNMAELHDIDYNEVLAAIYSTNPIGSGVI
jgi:spermidine synthase